MSGRCRSRTIASGRWARASSSPRRPCTAERSFTPGRRVTMRSTRRRFDGLSSIYSTVPDTICASLPGALVRCTTGSCDGASARGSSSENAEPVPSVLSARSVPPMSSTRPFDSARPSPVPSIDPSGTSRRSNGVKSRCIRSGAMPGPVSVTVRRHRPDGAASHETVTAPSGRLYLTALERRFSSTCCSR